MQKAHLYGAIRLVNRGVDEAVRGLERLKRTKDSQRNPASFDDELVLFEDHPARLNSYFCSALQRAEGKPPKVRFFTEDEQREWERQYPKPAGDVAGEMQRREGAQG
jgi:hypothetical protein